MDLEQIKYIIKSTFLDQIEYARKHIYRLPAICKSSSLFVDPSSRIFKSSAAKPYKANGNKQTVHVYPNMNLSKLIFKEVDSKHHQHKQCLWKEISINVIKEIHRIT